MKRHKKLFNRFIESFDDFVAGFISQREDGSLKANGLIWQVDDVGILFITDIYPGYQASVHCAYWDRKLKGREEISREMARYLFKEFGFHRLVAEIPLHSMPTVVFTERVGFKKEGRLRKAFWYRGEWWDGFIFSLLEEDLDELGTGSNVETAEVAGHTAG